MRHIRKYYRSCCREIDQILSVAKTRLMIKNRRDLIKRVKLSDVLPLRTPFTIYVDPSSACNFNCNFCYHSIDNRSLKAIKFKKTIMKMVLYEQIIDSIGEFPDKLKQLSLFIKGEPLLNPKLPEMIVLAKKKKIAEKIYITTNGALFSPRLNRKLVNAGIDEILVSIESVDSAEYRSITGVQVDFDEIVANIKDFFQNKGRCNFFVKTVCYTQEREQVSKFHEIFDPICDFAYVEQIVPVFDLVDYDAMPLDRSKLDSLSRPIHVCTRPFFNLCVHSNGIIGACLADYVPEIVFGNVMNDALYDVWRGKKFEDFRMMHLKKLRYEHPKCGYCVSPEYDTQDADLLDNASERLIEVFSAQKHGNPHD